MREHLVNLELRDEIGNLLWIRQISDPHDELDQDDLNDLNSLISQTLEEQ